MFRRGRAALAACLLAAALAFRPGPAHGSGPPESLQADTIRYEEKDNRLTAAGNVLFVDGDYRLTAAAASYDIDGETLRANGAVVFTVAAFNAKGETAVLQAENITFDRDHEKARAENGVVLTIGGTVVTGQTLEYDRAAGRLTVNGAVAVRRDADSPVHGDSLVYDTALSRGTIANFATAVVSEGVEYATAGKALTFGDDKTEMSAAVVTTCDRLRPHYTLRVGKVEHYHDKKLVLSDSQYWQGDKKLLAAKKTVVAIRDGEPVLPVTGYNDQDGWYIRTREYYDLAGKDYGVVYADYMAWRGLGVGVREFRHDKAGVLRNEYSLYASRKPWAANQIVQGEWRSAGGSRSQLISFRSEENDWRGAGDLLSANWYLMDAGKTAKTVAEASASRQIGSATFTSIRLGQTIGLDKEVRGFWDYSATRNLAWSGYKYTDRTFDTRLEWTKPGYVAAISTQEKKNGIDYTPKLAYYTTRSSPWQFAVATAHATSADKSATLQQTDLKTYYRTKPRKIAPGTFVSTVSTASYSSFGATGASDLLLKTNLLKNISEKIYINTSLSLGQGRGYNPLFKTAAVGATRQFDVETDYILDEYHRVNLIVGYDLARRRYRPLLLSLEGRAYPFWNWNLYSEYQPSQSGWNTVGAMLAFDPGSGVTGYIRTEYDLAIGALREASIRLEGLLAKKWSCSVKTDYYSGGAINLSEIQFVKDNHCQDLVVSYYPRQKMFFCQIRLKNPSRSEAKPDA
ncbi:LptA/OstA family protein [Anaeroselena agilis]|uniref:LptA/OstA family protein n=1 Tax=Anaeroselena agilis TaxID=3063788 RepID=A0ABU3P4H8_9FIRM|nr:LptA/OstA family protein [Selenomonadales bacterium 4137-cl]